MSEQTAVIEMEIRHEMPVADLTKAWSEEEKARLAAGDNEASEALEEALITQAFHRPDYCETTDFEIRTVRDTDRLQ